MSSINIIGVEIAIGCLLFQVVCEIWKMKHPPTGPYTRAFYSFGSACAGLSFLIGAVGLIVWLAKQGM